MVIKKKDNKESEVQKDGWTYSAIHACAGEDACQQNLQKLHAQESRAAEISALLRGILEVIAGRRKGKGLCQ
jgi:hypothetical protein